MPNVILYLILVLIVPLIVICIGDKRIDKAKSRLKKASKAILSLPRALFSFFKSTKPAGKKYGRFHSNNQGSKKGQGQSTTSKTRFKAAFEQHFNPDKGQFRKHDVYRIGRRFYQEFSDIVDSLNCDSFRSYRNNLYHQIHPDKAAQSHLTVDEATNVFQYFNQHFPRS